MLVGGVIDDELGDHLQSQPVRLAQHGAKIVERAELRMHVLIVGNVVAVVLERRGIEGHQPDGVDPEVPDVVELGGQALEIADAIVVRIEERLDVELVDDRVLVPERVVGIEPESAADSAAAVWTSFIGLALTEIVEIMLGAHMPPEPEHVRGLALRIEHHVIARAAPLVALVAQQVVHLVRCRARAAAIEIQINPAGLRHCAGRGSLSSA